MVYFLNYHDLRLKPGATRRLSRGTHAIVFLYEGAASFNGQRLVKRGAVYTREGGALTAGAKGARIFYWQLSARASRAARMSQELWSLSIKKGSRWLFRLDSIDNPPGVVADVHTHPGPGIRALLTGTFRVRQPSEDGKGTKPGDPWWESGVEAVISTPSKTKRSAFLRCMVLPPAYKGRPDTAKWLRRPPKVRSGWKLYVDEPVVL